MKFQYENYKGEVENRDVKPVAIVWKAVPGWGYEPGLFLDAWDNDREGPRSFRLDNRFQPTKDAIWDDGGNCELYRFPSSEQATLTAIQDTVLALVGKLDGSTLVQYQPSAPVGFFYRHKALDEPITGPVDELPEIVRINRDVYDVWAAGRV